MEAEGLSRELAGDLGRAVVAFLEIRGLSRRFPGVDALRDVNLDAEPGEVHALIGANGAGKSTLMNLLGGVLPASSGEIRLAGARFAPSSPRAAQAAGVSTVYQELSLIAQRSIDENIFLGREPANRLGIVDRARLRTETETLLRRYHLPLDPLAPVEELTVAQQQMVEIARALSVQARVLILDEPTAVLSLHERENLFDIIKTLKGEGVLVLYVSHRLDEIFAIADRVTVLRDGRKIATVGTAETTERELVRMMIGHDVRDRLPLPHVPMDEPPLLEVTYETEARRCSFVLRRGELLGIAGFVGAGRSFLARSIMGAARTGRLEMRLAGQPLRIESPRDAINHGILYLTEDRKREGLFDTRSVLDNTTAAALPLFSRAGILHKRTERQRANAVLDGLRLVAHSLDAPVIELSGGNQQKVVLGRALLRQPKVLICDEPTRGVDVGAKEEIYAILLGLAEQGVGIIVISSEAKELLALTHRTLVMRDRTIVAEFQADAANEAEILLAATGAARTEEMASA